MEKKGSVSIYTQCICIITLLVSYPVSEGCIYITKMILKDLNDNTDHSLFLLIIRCMVLGVHIALAYAIYKTQTKV